MKSDVAHLRQQFKKEKFSDPAAGHGIQRVNTKSEKRLKSACVCVCVWLTDTDGGEESCGNVWRQAVLEGWLQDVIGECERDDSQRGRIHDEDGAP